MVEQQHIQQPHLQTSDASNPGFFGKIKDKIHDAKESVERKFEQKKIDRKIDEGPSFNEAKRQLEKQLPHGVESESHAPKQSFSEKIKDKFTPKSQVDHSHIDTNKAKEQLEKKL